MEGYSEKKLSSEKSDAPDTVFEIDAVHIPSPTPEAPPQQPETFHSLWEKHALSYLTLINDICEEEAIADSEELERLQQWKAGMYAKQQEEKENSVKFTQNDITFAKLEAQEKIRMQLEAEEEALLREIINDSQEKTTADHATREMQQPWKAGAYVKQQEEANNLVKLVQIENAFVLLQRLKTQKEAEERALLRLPEDHVRKYLKRDTGESLQEIDNQIKEKLDDMRTLMRTAVRRRNKITEELLDLIAVRIKRLRESNSQEPETDSRIPKEIPDIPKTPQSPAIFNDDQFRESQTDITTLDPSTETQARRFIEEARRGSEKLNYVRSLVENEIEIDELTSFINAKKRIKHETKTDENRLETLKKERMRLESTQVSGLTESKMVELKIDLLKDRIKKIPVAELEGPYAHVLHTILGKSNRALLKLLVEKNVQVELPHKKIVKDIHQTLPTTRTPEPQKRGVIPIDDARGTFGLNRRDQ